MIDSYLSIQHIYTYQNTKYYKMNVTEKKWINVKCDRKGPPYVGSDCCMTLCNDGSLLLTPNLSNVTAKGKVITKYRDDTWSFVTIMEEDRAYYSMVEYENQFWIIGGKNGGHNSWMYKPTNTLFNWNLTKGRSSCAEPQFCLSGTSSVLFNNKIYVLGGGTAYDKVQRYDIHEDKWNLLQPMPIGVWSHRCVIYDEVRPSILVMGGFDTYYLFVILFSCMILFPILGPP